MYDLPVMCSVNPRLGSEYIYKELKKNGNGRAVAVIGGGPAGMEAAITLAARGFDVTLFEKDGHLGGTMNLADKPPHKELITELIKTMRTQLIKNGVKTVLGKEAVPEDIKKLDPAAVFVAAGAVPVIPNVKGIENINVCTPEDIITGRKKTGRTAVVVGTGMTGLEVSEMLLERGVKVTLAEMRDTVGKGIYSVILNDIMGRIKTYSPEILLNLRLTEITESGIITVDTKDGSEKEIKAETVVLSLGVKPDENVLKAFEAGFENVIPVGDVLKTGRISDAIRDGFIKAFAFDS